jgi:hypothetical protein
MGKGKNGESRSGVDSLALFTFSHFSPLPLFPDYTSTLNDKKSLLGFEASDLELLKLQTVR